MSGVQKAPAKVTPASAKVVIWGALLIHAVQWSLQACTHDHPWPRRRCWLRTPSAPARQWWSRRCTGSSPMPGSGWVGARAGRSLHGLEVRWGWCSGLVAHTLPTVVLNCSQIARCPASPVTAGVFQEASRHLKGALTPARHAAPHPAGGAHAAFPPCCCARRRRAGRAAPAGHIHAGQPLLPGDRSGREGKGGCGQRAVGEVLVWEGGQAVPLLLCGICGATLAGTCMVVNCCRQPVPLAVFEGVWAPKQRLHNLRMPHQTIEGHRMCPCTSPPPRRG